MTAKFAQRDVGPKYSFILDVEENFDYDGTVEVFRAYWWVPFAISILIYLPILKLLTSVMRNRDPLKLRVPLIFWNAGLALFSFIGCCRLFPELLYILQNHGFHQSMCSNSFRFSKPARYWIYMFVLSKIPELVDTVFLCLKKQKLIFLHVYHHASVLPFAWFMFFNIEGPTRWFTIVNMAVHTVMYSYYALKALPNLIRIPKWVSMLITTSQTLQMVFASYICCVTFYDYMKGENCHTNMYMSIFSFTIFTSYMVLFSNFFYKAYLAPKSPRDEKYIKDRKQA